VVGLPEHSEVEAVHAFIAGFVDAVNRGDEGSALASLTADVTIVEDLPPFRWHGPAAGAEWLGGMFENAQRLGISSIFMEPGRVIRIEIEDPHAYAVVEGQLRYGGAGPPLHADGVITFALVRKDGEWMINALVWSGPEATP
jgi:ketosteroid isomerase-like protein